MEEQVFAGKLDPFGCNLACVKEDVVREEVWQNGEAAGTLEARRAGWPETGCASTMGSPFLRRKRAAPDFAATSRAMAARLFSVSETRSVAAPGVKTRHARKTGLPRSSE